MNKIQEKNKKKDKRDPIDKKDKKGLIDKKEIMQNQIHENLILQNQFLN